jgi:hypothetical protein
MKKIIIILCATLFCMSKGFAQWKFSAVAGPQIANFGGSDKKDWGGTLSDPELVFRFHGGIMADRLLSEKVNLSMGLMFSSKGAEYSGGQYDPNSQFYTGSYTKRLSYLDIPILVSYNLSEKWSVGFGPQVSFLMSAKVKNDGTAQKVYGLPETEDVKDNYSTLDIGLNVGGAYKINDKFALQLFYQYGLSKIGRDQTDTSTGGTEETYDIKNRVLRLSFVYTFKQ